MKKRSLLTQLIVGIAIAVMAWHSSALAQSVNLTISAGVSLKDVLEDLQTTYQSQQPSTRLTFNFGSSGSLQQQIEQGAPVDIFISAAQRQMDALQEKDFLIPGTRQSLLRNTLVLITPQNAPASISDVNSLTRPEVKKIAVGEFRTVPVGQYTQDALTYLKLLDPLQPKLVFGKDVRQVLTYVENGEVEAGFVYLTDARSSSKVKIISTISTLAHTPIVYPVAVIKGCQNPEVAKAFIQFLRSEIAIATFEKFGFKLVPVTAGY